MFATDAGLVGALAYCLTELVKLVTFIPVNEGQKARIRTTASVLSLILAGVLAWMNGTLDVWVASNDVQLALTTIVGIALTFVIHWVRNFLTKKVPGPF